MILLIDFILVILISVCIFYCYLLSRRIEELQASKEEFRRIVKYFDAAIAKADDSIGELSKLSGDATDKISSAIGKAETLTSDLNFINEVGANIAEKLEKTMHEARTKTKSLEQKVEIRSEHSDYDDSSDYDEHTKIEHKNHLNPVIKNFSSAKSQSSASNMSYYDTLRKLGLKK